MSLESSDLYNYDTRESLLEKSIYESSLQFVILISVVPSILTVLIFPYTWPNVLVTVIPASIVYAIQIRTKGLTQWSRVQLYWTIIILLLCNFLGLAFFTNQVVVKKNVSLFTIIITSSILAPQLTIMYSYFVSFLCFIILIIPGTLFEYVWTSQLHLEFMVVFLILTFYSAFLARILEKSAPANTLLNAKSATLSNSIDSILSHIFPPHIAYQLSKKNFISSSAYVKSHLSSFQKKYITHRPSIYDPNDIDKKLKKRIFRFLMQELDSTGDIIERIPSAASSSGSNSSKKSLKNKILKAVGSNSSLQASTVQHVSQDSSTHSSTHSSTQSSPLSSKTNSRRNSTRDLFSSSWSKFKLNGVEINTLDLPEPPQMNFFSRFWNSHFRSTQYIVERLSHAVILFLSLDPVDGVLDHGKILFIRKIIDIWDSLILGFSECPADKIKVFETSRLLLLIPRVNTKAMDLVELLIGHFLRKQAEFNSPFHLSVGISYGEVTSGVWGRSLFQYDLIGSNVNLAARLATSQSEIYSKVERPSFDEFQSMDPDFVDSSISVTSAQDLSTFLTTTTQTGSYFTDPSLTVSSASLDIPLEISETGAGAGDNTTIETPNEIPIDNSNDSLPVNSSENQSNDSSTINRIDVIVSEPFFNLFPQLKSEKLFLSLKGFGKKVPAHKLIFTKTYLKQLSKSLSISTLRSDSNSTRLTIPHFRDFLIIRMTFFGISAAWFAATSSFPNYSYSIQAQVIATLYFVVASILFLGFIHLTYENHKIVKSLGLVRKASSFQLSFQRFSKLHHDYLFIQIFLVPLTFVIGLGLQGNSNPGATFWPFGYTFTLLLLLDHGEFSKQINIVKITGLISGCILVFTSFFLTPPLPTNANNNSDFGSEIGPPRDTYIGLINLYIVMVFLLCLLTVHGIVTPLKRVQNAASSVKHLFSHSVHPSLKSLIVALKPQSADFNPFSYPLQALSSIPSGQVAVGYFDISNFTAYCASNDANHVIHLLDISFSKFDLIASEMKLVKAPAVGDAYVLLSNEPDHEMTRSEFVNRLKAICVFAQVISKLFSRLIEYDTVLSSVQPPLALRGAISFSKCSGALIGKTRPSFQYFGQAIDFTKKLQVSSPLGKVLVDPSICKLVSRDFLGKLDNLIIDPETMS